MLPWYYVVHTARESGGISSHLAAGECTLRKHQPQLRKTLDYDRRLTEQERHRRPRPSHTSGDDHGHPRFLRYSVFPPHARSGLTLTFFKAFVPLNVSQYAPQNGAGVSG